MLRTGTVARFTVSPTASKRSIRELYISGKCTRIPTPCRHPNIEPHCIVNAARGEVAADGSRQIALPGLRIPTGSSADLIRWVRASASGPSCAPSHGRFRVPTPCSPVIVPSSARATSITPAIACSARNTLFGIERVEHDQRVEVAVAGVAEGGDRHLVVGRYLLDPDDEVGDARSGHPHVLYERRAQAFQSGHGHAARRHELLPPYRRPWPL